VWVSDWGANAILRFDPKTETFGSFPLPDSYASVRQLAGRKGEVWGEAFKNLKGDLAIRPVFHQLEARIEAHIFIAFLAYCLHVTLARRLHALAPGLTPRSVLEKFAAVQMIDVHLSTTDGRELLLTRYTEPEPELRLLLEKLNRRSWARLSHIPVIALLGLLPGTRPCPAGADVVRPG
jgi:hypothetical protein